ncbi:insect cuticle protein domain-containing protein [Phthorimaea operculella]|nr:insect cuticle protein domain-containing protein [Phthorimaea operculella]
MWRDLDIVHLFIFTSLLAVCHARFISSPRLARMSLAEPMPYYFHNDIDGHPGTYSFGYDVKDPATGNNQYRTEERYPNGTVVGSYGYVDAWGRPQRYRYIADSKGYRVMRDPPYKPHRTPPSLTYPSYQTPAEQFRPLGIYPAQPPRPFSPSESYSPPSSRPLDEAASSVTWTRPKKQNKKKNNNYYVNRPTHNFIGPPSSYAED